MAQKYFSPSADSVESTLRKLDEEYPGVYFGSFAVARKVDVRLSGLQIAKTYVEPVLRELANEGKIEGIQIQLGLLSASRRFTAYRIKK